LLSYFGEVRQGLLALDYDAAPVDSVVDELFDLAKPAVLGR